MRVATTLYIRRIRERQPDSYIVRLLRIKDNYTPSFTLAFMMFFTICSVMDLFPGRVSILEIILRSAACLSDSYLALL